MERTHRHSTNTEPATIFKTGPSAHFFSQSSRETKAASHVLQTVWSYKELRNALTKDGWNKSHFQVDQSEMLQCLFKLSTIHLCDGR